MARDYQPKAEATVRAEIRRLKRLAEMSINPAQAARARVAVETLEWARGGDAPRPSSTV